MHTFNNFFGRQNELRKMKKRYDSDSFECIVIYGRRRVGKTALINNFCEGKKCIYFSALNSSSSDNLKALSYAIHQCEHPDSDSFPEYTSFDAAFAEITRLGKSERVIFVIDEYPYLAKSDDSISSRLQHLIDHQWANSHLYLILCGSSMSFMQNQVLGYESPLYGRRTAQFRIEPLGYREAALFTPSLSWEDKAIIYGITGGIPHYINKLGIKDNLDNALIENFFDTSSYLFEEPSNLLKQELREPAVYNSIISTIAEGSTKLGEISSKSGVPTGLLTKYITVLMELGIVKKETPITEKPGKKTLYIIDDEFFSFWYRFVPRNMSIIAADRMPVNYHSLVKNKFHDYMGLIFEKICRYYLLHHADDLPFEIASVGQWWGNDSANKREVQIDIVACPAADSTASGEFIIGSCKFRSTKVGMDELNLLKYYASVFGKGNRYHYYVFSLGGFTEGLIAEAELGSVHLVSLEKLYGNY